MITSATLIPVSFCIDRMLLNILSLISLISSFRDRKTVKVLFSSLSKSTELGFMLSEEFTQSIENVRLNKIAFIMTYLGRVM